MTDSLRNYGFFFVTFDPERLMPLAAFEGRLGKHRRRIPSRDHPTEECPCASPGRQALRGGLH
jgi:hypothetical protein